MTSFKITLRNGSTKAIEGDEDQSLMEAIRYANIDEVLALCSGYCSCATCHVFVDEQHLHLLPEMTSEENDLLDTASHRQANSRLSCQIPITAALEGIGVTIAPEEA